MAWSKVTGDSGWTGELQGVNKIKPKGRFQNRPKQTLGIKVESKLEAKEERKTPNHTFKTGERNQTELSLTGECSSDCGSEIESQLLNPHSYFCHLFQRTLM